MTWLFPHFLVKVILPNGMYNHPFSQRWAFKTNKKMSKIKHILTGRICSRKEYEHVTVFKSLKNYNYFMHFYSYVYIYGTPE